MIILEPGIVFSSGVTSTGKSTTLKEFVKKVGNAFYLDRDDINQGNLYVSAKQLGRELPSFEDYVAKDNVFPNHAREVQTPFGPKIQIDPVNAFYARHVRDQSYLIQTEVAKTNLALGKIPIIDCIVMRQIQDGTLQKFISHSSFEGYNKFLIHFIADEEVIRQRILKRAETDKYVAKRVEARKAKNPQEFHEFVTKEQPMVPEALQNYEHLLINTSDCSPEECAGEIINYISEYKS